MTNDEKKPNDSNGLIAHPEPGFVEPVVNALNNIGKSEEQIAKEAMQKEITKLFAGRAPKEAKAWESVSYSTNASGCSCEVWSRATEETKGDRNLELKILMSKIPAWAPMDLVLDLLSSVEGVTKIELREPNGDGVIKYLE